MQLPFVCIPSTLFLDMLLFSIVRVESNPAIIPAMELSEMLHPRMLVAELPWS